MSRLRQVVALAGLTALEALRQPVCLLLILLPVTLTALLPFIILHRFGEDGKLVRDSAFALQAVFGIFVAGYAASTALARELEGGTALAVLSKPVSRDLFYLAKFIGVCGVVLLFSCCCTLATLLAERVSEKFVTSGGIVGFITDYRTGWMMQASVLVACVIGAIANYKQKRPFGSVATLALLIGLCVCVVVAACFNRTGEWAPFAFRVEWRLLPVSMLIGLALVVMVGLALAVSTVLGTAPTLALCSAVFVLGLMSDYLFGRYASGSLWARTLYSVLPNWQHFWICDRLNGGGHVAGSYLAMAASYAAIYTGALLCIGMVIFRQRDL